MDVDSNLFDAINRRPAEPGNKKWQATIKFPDNSVLTMPVHIEAPTSDDAVEQARQMMQWAGRETGEVLNVREVD